MLIELLRPLSVELARRWVAALLLAPEDEREAIVAEVEREFVALYRSGAARSPGDDETLGVSGLQRTPIEPRQQLRDLAAAVEAAAGRQPAPPAARKRSPKKRSSPATSGPSKSKQSKTTRSATGSTKADHQASPTRPTPDSSAAGNRPAKPAANPDDTKQPRRTTPARGNSKDNSKSKGKAARETTTNAAGKGRAKRDAGKRPRRST